MKVIISKGAVARELHTPFALCGTPNDLIRLAREIEAQATTLAGYGWIRIDPSHPSSAPPNSPPRPWEEAS